MRTVAAIALGLALGSLPFVYYRFGVARHHVRHAEPSTRAAAAGEAPAPHEGAKHASRTDR